ncbi:MAG: hypothetical protein ABI851_07415 [Saprospiraceae bacterium]
MKKILIFILSIVLFNSCKTTYKLNELKTDQCSDFRYGMIEAKRVLNNTEKKELENKGMLVQDFLFETVYQGIWNKSWDDKKLSATPIKKLKEYSIEEKISEGIKLQELAEDRRPCTLLILAFASLNETELESYGKLLNSKSPYYRLETQYKYVQRIAENPCIKHISIIKQMDTPDFKN